MFVALSFIGILPEYILDCVHQIRLFFDGEIILIIDDLQSPFMKDLTQKYKVTIVNYAEVYSQEFIQCHKKNKQKFNVCGWLNGRELLFIRCFERFFLLGNTMKKHNLTDCFFMELDNLIYDDPRVWLDEFKKWNMCFMFDNYDRAASGVMYIKDSQSMDGLLEYTIEFINTWEEDSEIWLSEMVMLYGYYLSTSEYNIQFLPTFWSEKQSFSHSGHQRWPPNTTNSEGCFASAPPKVVPGWVLRTPTPERVWSGLTAPDNESLPSDNFDKYNQTIFDAAAIGVMLYGSDTGDKNNPGDIGTKNKLSLIDYTPYKLVWKVDEKNRNIPYFCIESPKGENEEKYVKINNLHVHCKNLTPGLSYPRYSSSQHLSMKMIL
jgi:hypothetical protein